MAFKSGSMTLWLIRSGETAWEAEGRVQGISDLPLGEAGRAAIAAEVAKLRSVAETGSPDAASTPTETFGAADFSGAADVSTVYSGPDEASTETTRMVARRLGARARSVPELADPNLGLLEGLTNETFAERYPSRYRQWEEDLLTLVPPEGEPIAEARRRILAAVLKIIRRVRGDEVAVVLRPYGLGFARAWLADQPTPDIRPLLHDRGLIERYAIAGQQLSDLERAVESGVPA